MQIREASTHRTGLSILVEDRPPVGYERTVGFLPGGRLCAAAPAKRLPPEGDTIKTHPSHWWHRKLSAA